MPIVHRWSRSRNGIDGLLWEPYMMSMVHRLSQSRDDVDFYHWSRIGCQWCIVWAVENVDGHCLSQSGDDVDGSLLEPIRRPFQWFIVGAVDYVDGASLEPETMSVVHCWSQAGENIDGTSLEPETMVHRRRKQSLRRQDQDSHRSWCHCGRVGGEFWKCLVLPDWTAMATWTLLWMFYELHMMALMMEDLPTVEK